MNRAGLVSRLLAAIVDVGVLAAGTTLADVVLSGIRYTVEGPPFAFPPLHGWAFGVGHSLLIVVYLTAAWALAGRTVGQLAMGLRVVTADGGLPGVGRALLRALVCVVFPIGVLWVLFSRRTHAVQDLVARTALIYDPLRL